LFHHQISSAPWKTGRSFDAYGSEIRGVTRDHFNNAAIRDVLLGDKDFWVFRELNILRVREIV